MKRETMLKALECCIKNDACDRCPMMESICDFPLAPMVQLPTQLVVCVMEDIRGNIIMDNVASAKRQAH